MREHPKPIRFLPDPAILRGTALHETANQLASWREWVENLRMDGVTSEAVLAEMKEAA